MRFSGDIAASAESTRVRRGKRNLQMRSVRKGVKVKHWRRNIVTNKTSNIITNATTQSFFKVLQRCRMGRNVCGGIAFNGR
jgi:hypothetical protein